MVGNMVKAVEVIVKSGHAPLLKIVDGQTLFGCLEPGTYRLTAVSPDPYSPSEFSRSVWQSQPFDLVVEKDKNYKLEVVPAAQGLGWEIRRVRD